MENKVIIEGTMCGNFGIINSVSELQHEIENHIFNDIFWDDGDTNLFRITIERIK